MRPTVAHPGAPGQPESRGFIAFFSLATYFAYRDHRDRRAAGFTCVSGVMAFTVVQRTAEIGLRMALGAGHNQVRLQILREGATLATGGLVLGLVGAYALGRAMQAMLFGTGALSVPVVLVAGLVLLGAALVACYVPARRASAVDPLIALRQ